MPYQSSLPDTLLIDDEDLQDLDGVWLNDLGFLLAPGQRRGENAVTPRRRGQDAPTTKVYDAYSFTVPITIQAQASDGTTSSTEAGARAQFVANWRALADLLVGANGLVVLTRRLIQADGSGYDEWDARGEFVTGLTPRDQVSATEADFDLQFINLDGGWSPDGSTWVT